MNFNEIQKQVSRLVGEGAGTAAYLSLERKFGDFHDEIPDYVRKPRLAFLSNFTIQGLPETVRARGLFHNLLPEIYNAPYNQYAQEILNEKSELYKFCPDVIYLFIDIDTLPSKEELTDLVRHIPIHSAAKIIVFNKEIKAKYPKSTLILPFNFQQWLKDSGHEKNWYTKYKELGDLRLAPGAFPDLAEQLLKFAVPVIYATKKCVVVDLDNTLWKGILGEDGIENIKPNKELQEYLLELFNKGTILAINSRNNKDEALEAIEKHPDMILRKDHFAEWQINWGNKAQNMISLAKDLNIGIDSLVFLDDDDFQLNLIREAFPQIATISFNDRQRGLETFKSYAGLSKFEFTEEDTRRGRMYAEERKREELQSSLKTLEDFLRELNLKVSVSEVGEETIPRAVQLTQKTNQFNLTTRRYSEDDLEKFLSGGWKIWTVSATDRFGDYGVVGLLMAEPKGDVWRVDNFLMSCRILGRGIEDKTVDFLFGEAKKNGIKTILAEYIATSKNEQAKDFWDKQGFGLAAQLSGGVKDGPKKYYRDV